jgi:hypothetical protein
MKVGAQTGFAVAIEPDEAIGRDDLRQLGEGPEHGKGRWQLPAAELPRLPRAKGTRATSWFASTRLGPVQTKSGPTEIKVSARPPASRSCRTA